MARPIRAAGRAKDADSPATRRSALSASWKPPPMQWPLIRAMVGLAIFARALQAFSIASA